MASSFTYTMLNGSDSASNPASAASKGDSQRARLHCADNINRFLVDQDQCAPVGLGPVQTQDEAKAAGEARASANISAFNRQFGCGNPPPGTKSTQK